VDSIPEKGAGRYQDWSVLALSSGELEWALLDLGVFWGKWVK
jgi:hypothetical protein